jgi:signal transduction histidine kinase
MRFLDRIAVAALVALLTWLLVMGFNQTDQRVQVSLASLDAYMTSESALHRDVLSARAGLLNNYDPLDVDLKRMTRAVGAASISQPSLDERRSGLLLEVSLQQQAMLTERFKTSNALVQNSLAYFAAYGAKIDRKRVHPEIQRGVERLSSAMFGLHLNNSRLAQTEVGTAIALLSRSCERYVCEKDVRNLMAHARLLKGQLPSISKTIEQMVRSGGRSPANALIQHLHSRQMDNEDSAARFRVSLYAASLILLYLFVRGGLAVRAQSAALQRQVALEHAVSRLSTRLIGVDADGIMPALLDALNELTTTLGANCGCFVDGSERVQRWSTDRAFTAEEISVIRAHCGHSDTRAIGVARIVAQTSRGEVARIIAAAQLDSLCCIFSPETERSSGLLLFGFTGTGSIWPAAQLSVLRSALDALSMSLDHAALQKERRRLEAQLEHARRMETVGAFASGIAHNFNNLLGAMSGQLEMAEETPNVPMPIRNHLQQIRLSADRGQDLIQALLSYGRRRDRRQRPIPIDALVLESRDLAMAALDASYRVSVENEAGDARVLADPVQLQQVLLNLCHNAAHAMHPGGTIRIRTARERVAQSFNAIGARINAGDYATICIEDHGCGMDNDLQQRIFEPFFTTKPSGTGLGLSTARDIVLEQRGALTLTSRVGHGTSVKVWLPFSAEAAPRAQQADLVAKGMGQTILYISVDDQKRIWGEDLLAALGYEPVGAASVEQALTMVRANGHRFDAVIVGGEEPIGLRDFFSRLRSLAPALPRILAVKHPERQSPHILLTAEITAVLQFPLNPRELGSVLHDALQSAGRTSQQAVGA